MIASILCMIFVLWLIFDDDEDDYEDDENDDFLNYDEDDNEDEDDDDFYIYDVDSTCIFAIILIIVFAVLIIFGIGSF